MQKIQDVHQLAYILLLPTIQICNSSFNSRLHLEEGTSAILKLPVYRTIPNKPVVYFGTTAICKGFLLLSMRNATDQASALTTAIIMLILITMIISIIIMSCDTQNIIAVRQNLC